MAIRVVPDRQGLVSIGKIKTNLVTEVALPIAGLGGEGGSYTVLLRRPRAEAPYPVESRVEGGNLIWVVTAADTAVPGTGKAECRWDGPNGEVGKSITYLVRVTDGLPDPTEAPEAWEGYIGAVARDAAKASKAAEETEKAYAEIRQGLEDGSFRGEPGPEGPQGPKGDPGAAGAAGKTPVKGTDYWTAADKADMVADVLAALPTWEGGSY